MAPGVIARLPNESPRFVPLPSELLSCCVADVAGKLQATLRDFFGWDPEDEIRVLFQEKDVEGESAASAFMKAMTGGQPCFVRVLFRLLGGKGGFGALLRKQGRGKKTTNFDAMRDLSGRRLRHSKAVDRIKEWMEEKKRQDELVSALTGEGPDLPKPTPEAESLDPDFVAALKRSAAQQPSLVRQGLKKLDAESGAVASIASSPRDLAAKRPKVDMPEMGGGWLSALETLGNSSPEPDSDDNGKDGSPKRGAGTGSSAAAASSACAAAAPATTGGGREVKCSKGHKCVRMTENPDEPGYDEPACCDVCEAEDLPGTCSHFYHCSACEFDLCPKCASLPGGGASSSAAAASGSAASSAASSSAAAASASGAASACAAAADDEEREAAVDTVATAAAAAAAAEARAAAEEKAKAEALLKAKAEAMEKAAIEEQVIGPEDLVKFSSSKELMEKVQPEVLKRSLQRLGLKCGGKPEDRAARFFLLKTTKLEALPKAHFAGK